MADHAHSDHGHDHDEHAPAAPPSPMAPLRLASEYTDGGHEVDATPNRNLMVFLAVMFVLIIVSALGVYQLFVSHTGAQLDAAAAAPTTQLADQHKRDDNFATTYGKVEVEGKLVAYRVPFAEAKRKVLENADAFKAAPAPEGWIHPDDAGKK